MNRELVMSRNNIAERNEELEQYADYVKKIVHQVIRDFDFPVQYFDDFYSDGFIGLLDAYDRFDPEEGCPFKQYAYYRVRGAILDGARKISEISPRTYRFLKSYQALSDLREHELKNQLSGASKLQTKEHSLTNILNYLHKGGLLFRLSTNGIGDENEWIPTTERDPEEQYAVSQNKDIFAQLVEQLPEKSKAIIVKYYFEDKSFIQVSQELGLSKSWISRMHRTALNQLRDLYVAYEEEKK